MGTGVCSCQTLELLVNENDYLGTYENLVMANGQMIRRPLAKVTFELRGRTFQQVVAVSQQGERDSFVFLSAPPMSEKAAIEAVEDLCDREVRRQSASTGEVDDSPPPAQVSAVLTRSAMTMVDAQKAASDNVKVDVVPPTPLEPGTVSKKTESAGEGGALGGAEVEESCDEVCDKSVGISGSDEVCELSVFGSPVMGEENSMDCLRSEILADDSLKHCRELADRKANGFRMDCFSMIH